MRPSCGSGRPRRIGAQIEAGVTVQRDALDAAGAPVTVAKGQHFVEEEFWNIGPYTNPEFVKSARQLFRAARDCFGDYRCVDLQFFEH